ncbi:MAG TPA: hypothetical protein VHO69_15905 [Phototrophicaceae bacterium]|nr:hypothetical protein [Phototrophicaceae bacterium]
MSELTIVENEFITVKYLDDKKIIYHTVHKPIPDQELKDALNAGTDALIKFGACKWLSDDRKNGPVSAEIAAWGRKDWNLRTIKGGWKYWANVVPEAVAAAGTLTPIIDSLFELGLRMVLFTSLEAAFEWLENIKTKPSSL